MKSDFQSKPVLCFGEVLWDSLPAGLFLGGAPFNVACHLHALGVPTIFAGRVGDDRLGVEIRRRLVARGMEADLLQVDPELPTGFVEVSLDDAGTPTFEILQPSAWDRIKLSTALEESASQAAAIIFGSLSQRNDISRFTLIQLCNSLTAKVFDVNLRPPFVEREIVLASLAVADIVKLNEDELREIASWLAWPESVDLAMAEMAHVFELHTICVTKGAAGAVLRYGADIVHHPGYRVQVADTVGAGDAFLAGFLKQLLAGADPESILDYASRVGAFVASRHGATPTYSATDLLDQR